MIVVAALLFHHGKVLIARRSPGRHLAGCWEFPGGKREAGETPEACLAREIREELGVDIEVGAFVASAVHAYEAMTIELLAYAVRPLSLDFVLSAHSDIRWVLPEELASYALAPADLPIARVVAARGGR